MIQRIQTIYLLLVVIITSVVTLTLTFADIHIQQGVYHLSPFGLAYDSLVFTKKQSFIGFPFYLVFIFYLLLVIRTMLTFKDLYLQSRLSLYSLVGSVLIFISVLVLPYLISFLFISEPANVSYNLGCYVLFILIPFTLLAHKKIKEDKALIDSVDRIR